jgi:hypothetical protein
LFTSMLENKVALLILYLFEKSNFRIFYLFILIYLVEHPVMISANDVCTHKSRFTMKTTIVAYCKTITDSACESDSDCKFKKFFRICFEGEKWLKVRFLNKTSSTWYETRDFQLTGIAESWGNSSVEDED